MTGGRPEKKWLQKDKTKKGIAGKKKGEKRNTKRFLKLTAETREKRSHSGVAKGRGERGRGGKQGKKDVEQQVVSKGRTGKCSSRNSTSKKEVNKKDEIQ